MMTSTMHGRMRALVVDVQTRVCAVPLTYIIETMRSLPIEPVGDAPPFVRGVSLIRGIPTPVVDLGILLGMAAGGSRQFVTLRMGQRQAALCVDGVRGVRELDSTTIQELPPLLRGASQDLIDAIGTLDQQMLVILRAGWQLPGAALQALASGEGWG